LAFPFQQKYSKYRCIKPNGLDLNFPADGKQTLTNVSKHTHTYTHTHTNTHTTNNKQTNMNRSKTNNTHKHTHTHKHNSCIGK